MPNLKALKALVSLAIPSFLLIVLVGCAGMEFAPRQGAAWFPRDYLLNNGVADGARMQTTGHGKSQPIADNSTEAGRFKNRRVEILILSE